MIKLSEIARETSHGRTTDPSRAYDAIMQVRDADHRSAG